VSVMVVRVRVDLSLRDGRWIGGDGGSGKTALARRLAFEFPMGASREAARDRVWRRAGRRHVVRVPIKVGRAALLVVALLAGACDSGGHGAEDERRLDVIAADPMATALPPGAEVTGGPEEILAETDDGRLAGCCTHGVVTRFGSADAVPTLANFYVTSLADAGWLDISVDCLSTSTKVTAVRSFDGFVGRFSVEFSSRDDPVSAVQIVSAQFHTKDYESPTNAATDDACIAGAP